MGVDLPSIEIELERGQTGLGFNIRGGVDQPYINQDSGIFVTKIREDGAAGKDGRLMIGDKILEINGIEVNGMEHDEVVKLFVNAGSTVRLIVQQEAEKSIMERYQTDVSEEPSKSNSHATWFVVTAILGVVITGVFYFNKKQRIF